MRGFSLLIILWLGAASIAGAAPFLSCDQMEADSFQYLVDEGPDWRSCPAVNGKMKCDLSTLPYGVHLLRGKTILDEHGSPGNSFIYLYKMQWKTFTLYYVVKVTAEGGMSWELQAIK